MPTRRRDPTVRRLLVVRNDRLGDLMLAWPALDMLRRGLPTCRIDLLASAYVAEMARLCSAVDDVLVDPPAGAGRAAERQLVQMVRERGYDAAILLHATTPVARALWRAGIPWRLAPASRLAMIFSNQRLRQRRSRSEKPEYEYNQDLAAHFLLRVLGRPVPRATAPLLRFPPAEADAAAVEFRARHGLGPEAELLFLHPGSGGSARNLEPEQYARLGRALRLQPHHHLVVTAGPGEEARAAAVAAGLAGVPHTIHLSTDGLHRFALLLASGRLFIGGSTGPLHIAGALDLPTAGFYPRRRSATALRWQTMNQAERRLAFSPPVDAGEEDMSRIDLMAAAEAITDQLLRPDTPPAADPPESVPAPSPG